MKFYKKTILIVIMSLCYCHINAQQIITGIVCNKATKLPVSEVFVYLDGTSFSTITNSSGKFELTPKSYINTKLVLYHLTFETTIIEKPFQMLPDTLFIDERVFSIPEINVVPDPFTRTQKLKAFREQFLGLSSAGKSCTITNEKDIEIWVNMETQTLYALSDKPIEVVNNYLGYKTSFILTEFWVKFDSNFDNLNDKNVSKTFFSVISSFTDISTNNRTIKRRRDNVYEQSSNYFFRSFANNELEDNYFQLFNELSPINPRQYFATKDTLSQKMIRIIPGTNILKSSEFSAVIGIAHRPNIYSEVYFLTDTFFVDSFGKIYEIDKIWYKGKLGDNRAGDMLPIEYEFNR